MKEKKETKEEKLPSATFKKIVKKSKAGVKYVHYVIVFPPNPEGFNYITRKRLDAVDKKQKQGREYFIKVGSKRIYIKHEKSKA